MAKSTILSIFALIFVCQGDIVGHPIKGGSVFPTEPYVRANLELLEPRLCSLFDNAWRHVAAFPGRSQIDYKRTVATLMHQYLMNEVRVAFVGSPEVHLLEDHETIRLLVNRTLRVRLKKMDANGRARAIPTQMTLELTNSDDGLLFGQAEMPNVYNVDIGYVLNELETKIEHILVAARHGEAVLWSYEADRGAMEVAGTIAPAPIAPTSSAQIIKLPLDHKGRKDDGRA